MIERKRKYGLFLMIILICMFSTGCIKGTADVTIAEDGSAKAKSVLASVLPFKDEIDALKSDLTKKNGSVQVSPYSDGNMSGYNFEMSWPNIHSMVKNSEFYGAYTGINHGVQEKKNWFFDAYSFDLYFTGDPAMQAKSAENEAVRALFQNADSSYTLNIPYRMIRSNADSVSPDGRTLKWNLTQNCLNGTSKNMQAEFRIYDKVHLLITGLGIGFFALVTLIALIELFVTEDYIAEWITVAGLSGLITLGGIGVTAWNLLADDVFTDRDTISTTYSADDAKKSILAQSNPDLEKKLQTKLNNQTGTAPNPAPVQQAYAPNAAPVSTQGAESQAKAALSSYYQAVQDGRYSDAYNMLSSGMQNQIGSYNRYASGYQTTLSNHVSDMSVVSSSPDRVTISYFLRARDRTGGYGVRVQNYNGSATLSQYNGSWYIVDMNVSKLGEYME